jgi:hypothetical protein
MRISMLAPFGIRPKGTLAVRMLPLAQALVRHGHHVTIIAPPVQNPQDAGQTQVYQGVAVSHITLPNLPHAFGIAQYVGLLVRAILASDPDIIHLFKPKGYSGLAALQLRLLRPDTPLVVDTDDWEGWGGWNDLLLYPGGESTVCLARARSTAAGRRGHSRQPDIADAGLGFWRAAGAGVLYAKWY